MGSRGSRMWVSLGPHLGNFLYAPVPGPLCARIVPYRAKKLYTDQSDCVQHISEMCIHRSWACPRLWRRHGRAD